MSMQAFISWFIEQLPGFLVSEPIRYFVGFFFLGITVQIFRTLVYK